MAVESDEYDGVHGMKSRVGRIELELAPRVKDILGWVAIAMSLELKSLRRRRFLRRCS